MIRSHYNVSRLLNTQMKTQVKNALNEIDGVKMVNVDLARSSIEVGYDESIDESTIKQCIENVGCKFE
ncbi:copper chaperone CopZ [Sedimentibacter acidaminivorans]|uniref:Copper chaperone CopZ n=1 Tax=Sedimentibacter acidaminivorans TaxID=913099 RepID=A0ABS4GAU6_9FIRM|nr:heavy metal-associated domain-containing protein [Sedimentibacter acidaminivorans]MBP1924796.1 copper chaperone CopZ [Sedimentibacter acidaminivorans]